MIHYTPTMRQIYHLVALADTGSYEQACLRCGVSRSTIQWSIGRLQRDIGVTLVSDGGKTFTDAGSRYVVRCREIIAIHKDMQQ